jgi:hypothetical protein
MSTQLTKLQLGPKVDFNKDWFEQILWSLKSVEQTFSVLKQTTINDRGYEV